MFAFRDNSCGMSVRYAPALCAARWERRRNTNMSFDGWDVDQYKTEHECDEHWELRRKFMVAHKDKFSEDQLVCLAQVFTNMEFLGCRYPAETMRLVESLAEGVADDYREKQKGRLQRTFIKASDAAGAKAKGLKRPLQEEEASGSKSVKATPPVPLPKQQNASSSSSFTVEVNLKSNYNSAANSNTKSTAQVTYGPTFTPASQSQNSSTSDPSRFISSDPQRVNNSKYGGVKTYHINQPTTVQQAPQFVQQAPQTSRPHFGSYGNQTPELPRVGPYGKLVLVEPSEGLAVARDTLFRSTTLSQVPYKMNCVKNKDSPNELTVEIYINNRIVARGSTNVDDCLKPKKVLVRELHEEALEEVKKSCYTLKMKLRYFSDTQVDKTSDISLNAAAQRQSDVSLDTAKKGADLDVPMAEDNIGNRLLRSMGWSGGGLGKNAQGIEEPVRIERHVNRAGLGLPAIKGKAKNKANQHRGNATVDETVDEREFKQKVKLLMKDFAFSDSEYDLIFSPEFTIEERQIMHSVATQFRLKTKSYGKDNERHLVVSKKRDMWKTLEQLIQCGGSNERFDLVGPMDPAY